MPAARPGNPLLAMGADEKRRGSFRRATLSSPNYFPWKRPRLPTCCNVPSAVPPAARFCGRWKPASWRQGSSRSRNSPTSVHSCRNRFGNGFERKSTHPDHHRYAKISSPWQRLEHGWPRCPRGLRVSAAICKCTPNGATDPATFKRWRRRPLRVATNTLP